VQFVRLSEVQAHVPIGMPSTPLRMTKMRQQKCDNKNVTTKTGVKKLNFASLHAYFTPTIKELSELCG
jgi:hypothetical protein